MIQRFGLLVWPDTGTPWRDVDRWPDSDARRVANATSEPLDGLNPESIGGQKDEPEAVPYQCFGAEGLALFREWREGWSRSCAAAICILRSNRISPSIASSSQHWR